MSYSVIFLSRAQQELAESWEWYENKKSGLGDKFKDIIITRIYEIQQHPERYPERKKSFRETSIKIFPYIIIYKINGKENTIAIVSIFHTSRHPKRKYRK